MAAMHGTAAETIGELAKLFPQALSTDPSKIRPLIVGLKKELLQLCKRSPDSLDDAMRYYTGSVGHQKRMTEGTARVDRKGQAAGLVTARQAKAAQHRVAAMGGKVATKSDDVATDHKTIFHAAEKEATLAPRIPASAPAPPRLGLSDLKRAAAARRTMSG